LHLRTQPQVSKNGSLLTASGCCSTRCSRQIWLQQTFCLFPKGKEELATRNWSSGYSCVSGSSNEVSLPGAVAVDRAIAVGAVV
jgi:hypothetical protein